jgi:UDP-N-acetylglucosamine--N-acetylmuramyl-(pentapeptide) pyrophosphoryl-undecaprenol N-acetylglucosamine transferase
VPRAVLEADRASARERLGLAPDGPVLLVFGGSQGALSINTAVMDGLLDADPGFHVLHVTGTRDHEMVASRVAEAGAEDRFTVLEYVKDLGDPLAACDLVLARSGASVFELAAAGRPAILVPYPYATGRHQHANAEWMASAGAALVVEDSELNGPKVLEAAGGLLGTPERLRAMAEASAGLAMPDAAEQIATEVLSAIGGAG